MAVDEMAPTETRRALRLSGTASAPSWRGRLHLWAAVASIPGGIALVLHHPSPPEIGYAIALTALFGVSAAYHLAGSGHEWLRRADHAVIYLYMAAAYVPFCREVVKGTVGEVLLALALAGGGVGAAMKMLRFHDSRLIGAVLYAAIGGMAVVAIPEALRTLSPTELALLGVTGLSYTAGALMFSRRWPDPLPSVFGYHEVWHACVVAATAAYFVFVWMLLP